MYRWEMMGYPRSRLRQEDWLTEKEEDDGAHVLCFFAASSSSSFFYEVRWMDKKNGNREGGGDGGRYDLWNGEQLFQHVCEWRHLGEKMRLERIRF